MNRPDWSVMIPAHQPDPRLLAFTLASIAASGLDLRTNQVALVLAGPRSPALDALIADWQPRGLEVHTHPGTGSLANDWNHALSLARGRFLHLLHQDDAVRPGFYDALAAGFAADPRCGAACTQTEFIDTHHQHLRFGHLDQRDAGPLRRWIEHLVVNLALQCPCIAVRREVYERIGRFDPSYTYCTDADQWARIATEYPVWYDPRPLACYREHPASATHTLFPLPRRWRERRRCLRAAAARLSPVIRATALAAGSHYQTRLALTEWNNAWRTATRPLDRIRLLLWHTRLGPRRDRTAIRENRYPAPVPGRPTERSADPATPRQPRVMLLSEFFPHPPDRAVFGVFQRLYRTVEGLSRYGHLDAVFFWSDNYQVPPDQVAAYHRQLSATWPLNGTLHLVSTSTGPTAEAHRHPVRALYWLVRGALSFMQNRPSFRCGGSAQADHLRTLLLELQPDLILAHRTGVAGTLMRQHLDLPPVVLDLEDIDHVKILRFHREAATAPPAWRVHLWAMIARWSTFNATRFANLTLVCSERDRATLRRVAPFARIAILPNTSFARPALPPAPGRIALFVGVAYYPPNAEAIRWLVTDIWPRVRARCPDAVAVIVGEGAAEAAGETDPPGIQLVGFAPDLALHYQHASVCLCPIRRGSGTRIKIIEAAFSARPVVATTIGAEGLTFTHGTDILIADTTEAFADAIIDLFEQPARRAEIGHAARRRADTDYAPAVIVDRLVTLLRDTAAARPEGRA